MEKKKFGPITAILPIKKRSTRVPNKNFRELGGRPLFQWALTHLNQAASIDNVVVDTDSTWLIEHLRRHWPGVWILKRPPALTLDSATMNDVLENTLAQLEGNFFVQVHTTSPFLSAKTIDDAVKTFKTGWPEADSLVGVSEIRDRLWSPSGTPVNHDPKTLLQTQDLKPILKENSAIYVFEKSRFLERKNRVGSNPQFFPTPDLESIDIDTESDFSIAQALVSAGAKL